MLFNTALMTFYIATGINILFELLSIAIYALREEIVQSDTICRYGEEQLQSMIGKRVGAKAHIANVIKRALWQALAIAVFAAVLYNGA